MPRNNKLIFKNSFLLYFRLIITMAVSLITARIVLRELGVENYGTYNIVAGLITMFASLKSMFSCAIQRYYNFEIGQNNDPTRITELFNHGIFIHLALAVLLILFIEPFGIWMINNKLDIPQENHTIAHIIFQFNIIMMFLTMMIIPYNAMVVARERMGFYAGLSLLDAVLKLIQALSLIIIPANKLFIYASCILFIAFVNFLIEIVYVKKNFKECYFKKCWNKKLFKSMSKFAGWNFFGNTSYTLTNEVLNIFLNLFCGVVANAARGIASQVRNVIQSLLANALIAVRPQATQEYAKGSYDSFFQIVYFSSKTVFFLALCITLPLFFYIEEILHLWLGQVPEYSVVFIRILLLQILIRSFHEPIDLIFKSSGNLKWYQLMSFFVAIVSLPVIYFCLRKGCPIYIVFVGQCCMELMELIAIVLLSKGEGLKLSNYCKFVLFRVLIVTLASLAISIIIYEFLYDAWFLCLCFIICAVALSIILLGYSKKERELLLDIVKRR